MTLRWWMIAAATVCLNRCVEHSSSCSKNSCGECLSLILFSASNLSCQLSHFQDLSRALTPPKCFTGRSVHLCQRLRLMASSLWFNSIGSNQRVRNRVCGVFEGHCTGFNHSVLKIILLLNIEKKKKYWMFGLNVLIFKPHVAEIPESVHKLSGSRLLFTSTTLSVKYLHL